MTVKENQGQKIITLSKAFDTRAKILNTIYFMTFSFVSLFWLFFALSTGTNSIPEIIFTIIFVGAYLFAGYRFINKALQTEKLFVNKNSLTICKTGFLNREQNIFETTLISNFRHLEKPIPTKHPLAGQTFDYLGFQTEQQVINEMHGDNRLAFNYNGKTIKFGQNVYTWDFDKLVIELYDTTGIDFCFTENFETNFNLTD